MLGERTAGAHTREDFNDFKHHFSFFHPDYRDLVALGILLSMLLGLLALLETFAIKSAVGYIVDGTDGLQFFSTEVSVGIGIIPILLLIIFINAAGTFGLDIVQAHLMIRVRDQIEVLVLKHILIQPYVRLRNISIGDLIGRLSTDLPRAMIYREQVIVVLTSTVTIIAYGIFVAYHSVPLAIALLSMAAAGAITNQLLSLYATPIDREFRAASDLARIRIDELVRNAKEIRANGLIETNLTRFWNQLIDRRRPFMRLSYYLARLKASNGAWPTFGIMLAVTTIVYFPAKDADGGADVILLPALIFIIFGLFTSLRAMVEAVVELRLIFNSFVRLREYQVPPQEVGEWIAESGEHGLPIEAIELDHVGYRHTDGHSPAGVNAGIEDISLRLGVPGWIAIVGPSGAGKSTLLDILIGEARPQSGTIVYRPAPTCVNRVFFAKHISYLSQSPQLFRGTVWENLSVQLPPAFQRSPHVWIENPRLLRLLECSGLARQLELKVMPESESAVGTERLRMGLELSVGLYNTNWSGGEVKLLGIVRCLASEAEVLVLDEPTASLDTKLVEKVAILLGEEAKRRLVVTVTHDEMLQAHAGSVIRLSHGKVT